MVLNKRELLIDDVKNKLVNSLQKVSSGKLILISAAMSKGLDALLEQVWEELDK